MQRLGMFTVAVFAIVLAACSHKVTVTTANGETVTTNSDNKTSTITTKDGTVTVGQNMDLSKLPVPVYPGAQQVGSMSGNSAKGSALVVSLKTPDAFDKVAAWYKSQLPAGSQQMISTAGGSSFAEYVVASSGTQIMVTGKATETDMVITQTTSPAP